MITTNLFVIANVKQLPTGGSVKILLHCSERLGVLFSYIQQFLPVFTIGLCLERFCWAFGISGGGGVFVHPNPPSFGTPLSFTVRNISEYGYLA